MSHITRLFRNILSDVFEIGNTSEEVWVAVTYVLNVYDFFLSKDCPGSVGEVELTIGAAVEIVSVLAAKPSKKNCVHSWWKKRWNQQMAKQHARQEFADTVEEVIRAISKHPWIDHIQ